MRLGEYQIANTLIDIRLVMTSRLVFTGDSAASNPRLWSGHPKAVQIVVRQSVEKIPDHSVTNQILGALRIIFSSKTLGFRRFRIDFLRENPSARTTF